MANLEGLSLNGELQVTQGDGFVKIINNERDLLDNKDFKAWVNDHLADKMAAWYGLDESPQKSLENDFGQGCNAVYLKLNDKDEVVGYVSGSSNNVEFLEVQNDMIRRGFPCDDEFDIRMKGAFGKSALSVFKTYGFAIDPENRRSGLGASLIKAVLESNDIYYGETRNFSLVRTMARMAEEQDGYLQFGFKRIIPEWANGLRTELSTLIRFFWYETLRDVVDKDQDYNLTEEQRKRYPQGPVNNGITSKLGFSPLARVMPLHIPAPSFIPRGDQDIREGELFEKYFKYLQKHQPDIYMPRMFVRAPRR